MKVRPIVEPSAPPNRGRVRVLSATDPDKLSPAPASVQSNSNLMGLGFF